MSEIEYHDPVDIFTEDMHRAFKPIFHVYDYGGCIITLPTSTVYYLCKINGTETTLTKAKEFVDDYCKTFNKCC
jgi:hypothetical protein